MTATSFLLTYRDIIDHLVDWQGGSAADVDDRRIRRSIQEAYRQLSTDHQWSYYYVPGRIITVAPVTDGTVTYSASTNQVTLTDSTWPSWVTSGKVKIGSVICPVYTQDSSTVITLDPNVTFADDIASTTYELFQSAYPLPLDFISMSEVLQESSWWGSTPVTPNDFLALERYGYTGIGTPQHWTIMGDPNNLSNLAIHFDPAPSTASTLDFVYYRRGRALRYTGYEAAETQGTVTVSSGSATVTGSDTAFSSSMVGSILRLSDVSSIAPTGLDGEYPYAEEKVITAVASATSATVDSNFSAAYSGVAYNISDPVDIDPVMVHPFRMGCIKWLASMSKDGWSDKAEMEYTKALLQAAGADSRFKERRVIGASGLQRFRRLAYIPLTDSE